MTTQYGRRSSVSIVPQSTRAGANRPLDSGSGTFASPFVRSRLSGTAAARCRPCTSESPSFCGRDPFARAAVAGPARRPIRTEPRRGPPRAGRVRRRRLRGHRDRRAAAPPVQFLAQLTMPTPSKRSRQGDRNLDLDAFLGAMDTLHALDSFKSPLGEPEGLDRPLREGTRRPPRSCSPPSASPGRHRHVQRECRHRSLSSLGKQSRSPVPSDEAGC